MIEVKNLTKRFGQKTAVQDISFTVQDGEILGFLGPNGAGKSTTMNIITGYIGATEGTVTVDEDEILENPIAVKSRIGYLPEQPPLYLDMTVKEYLSFMFDLKRVKEPKKAHIEAICEEVGIADVYERLIRNLSKGYRQRVGLAQALLGSPSLLILDEPTAGLDPKQIIEIRNLIKSLGETHTIILSSHILSEVQAVCERVIVINRGRLIADDSPDNLSTSLSTDHRLTVRVDGPEQDVQELLAALPDVLQVDALGEKEEGAFDFLVEAEPGADIRREMFGQLAEQGWPLLGLRSSELSLEDVFLQLTHDDVSESALAAEADGESDVDTPDTDEADPDKPAADSADRAEDAADPEQEDASAEPEETGGNSEEHQEGDK